MLICFLNCRLVWKVTEKTYVKHVETVVVLSYKNASKTFVKKEFNQKNNYKGQRK